MTKDLMGFEFDDIGEELDTIGELIAAPDQGLVGKAAKSLTPFEAYWPKDPQNAPDTWHLPPEYSDHKFALTVQSLLTLARANDFQFPPPEHDKLIIALRGCQLEGGATSVEAVQSAQLVATRPNHEDYRCLIGVADTASGRISLYQGSTVPRRTGMARYANGGSPCNLLPTGCYRYAVGTHYSRTNGALYNVLRLGDGPEIADASMATVLRTTNDLAYGTRDAWDRTKPADNIHPAFLTNTFSSLGCITVQGSQQFKSKTAKGSGLWQDFRVAAGIDGSNRGARYDMVMVTGHEAAAYAHAVDPSTLVCLRHGSDGDRVERLQSQLNLNADGDFGPTTKHALAKAQMGRLGWATGTWSPAMATLMGWEF